MFSEDKTNLKIEMEAMIQVRTQEISPLRLASGSSISVKFNQMLS